MTLPAALALEIVTPDRPVAHEQVDEVQLPGRDGALGILPGHTPLLAMLNPGELWYRKGTQKTTLVIDFGLAEVLPDRVTVLISLAERPEDIDPARQQAARQEAEQELKQAVSLEDAERARVALLTAMMKLRAAEQARARRGV
jgi:F-type H+-transporting ATPase subunit epsilon